MALPPDPRGLSLWFPGGQRAAAQEKATRYSSPPSRKSGNALGSCLHVALSSSPAKRRQYIAVRRGRTTTKQILYLTWGTLQIAPANVTFTNTVMLDEGPDITFGGFWELTVTEKAKLCAEWKQAVTEYQKSHPYYPYPGDLVYEATKHTYGVPDQDDLSQMEATVLAQQAIISLGASESTINKRRIECSFDVSDINAPIWKIVFSNADIADKKQRFLDRNFGSYRVTINAKSGELIEAYLITGDMKVEDFRF